MNLDVQNPYRQAGDGWNPLQITIIEIVGGTIQFFKKKQASYKNTCHSVNIPNSTLVVPFL